MVAKLRDQPVQCILDGMAAGGGNATVGDPLSKYYNGEARFVRALCYYSLLQLYARPYWDGNGAKRGLAVPSPYR